MAQFCISFRKGGYKYLVLYVCVCVSSAEFVESDGNFSKGGNVMYCDKLATWLIRALGSCFVCVCPVLSL